jgi:hypothetical protein
MYVAVLTPGLESMEAGGVCFRSKNFGEALQTQVVVPLPGELLVLFVQARKVNVVAASMVRLHCSIPR